MRVRVISSENDQWNGWAGEVVGFVPLGGLTVGQPWSNRVLEVALDGEGGDTRPFAPSELEAL